MYAQRVLNPRFGASLVPFRGPERKHGQQRRADGQRHSEKAFRK
jgi:hypothetical protein